jgi:DNA-directed RNA polymerase subunit RPC12/RpoP
MPPETPIKCDNCGNEELVHGLRLGRLNGVMGNLGGPGQEPPPMGNQWAVYMCLQCDGIFPYKKHYTAQPGIQSQYERVYRFCKDRMEHRKRLEEIGGQLESMRDAKKALSVLPGAMGSNEVAMSAKLEPLIARLEQVEAEIQKRKGGRPPGSKTKVKDNE